MVGCDKHLSCRGGDGREALVRQSVSPFKQRSRSTQKLLLLLFHCSVLLRHGPLRCTRGLWQPQLQPLVERKRSLRSDGAAEALSSAVQRPRPGAPS